MALKSTQEPSPNIHACSDRKAIVVGLYGIPGSGKSFLLQQLKENLGQSDFTFYEGSEMIASICPGGLEAFQNTDELEQMQWRRRAVSAIAQDCVANGRVGVVTGHLMFWSEARAAAHAVYTDKDMEIFTHILYLDVPIDVIEQRRVLDIAKIRSPISTINLRHWQQDEKAQLRHLCRNHAILFMLLSPHPILPIKTSALLRDFRDHSEEHNLSQAKRSLDDAILPAPNHRGSMLVMDADGTLASTDTGADFWENITKSLASRSEAFPLKELFSSQLGYSYIAFRQAVLLYEEIAGEKEFDTVCEDVASTVSMHPDFVSLLRLVEEQTCLGAVVITCGLRRIWQKVLEREGLSQTVKVIGGGRIADGFVVTPAVKGELVARLRETHGMFVWAFGDSPLDLNMLRKADKAIVVCGEEQSRSQTMNSALAYAIDHDGLQAHQVLLPTNTSPRLNTIKLPVIELTEAKFIKDLLRGPYSDTGLQVHCATDSNARLIATSMRDAASAGPQLRQAHHRVGWYLSVEYLVDVVGLEGRPIRHVLGHETKGYQFFHERQTTIVALMRGGEPMAYGVSDALPLAMFVHAGDAEDLKRHHLRGQLTVILVDSVVNTGKTIAEFVQHVRKLHATIRIVVVCGVVQAQCLSESGLGRKLKDYGRVHLVALRVSDTKFTGSGTTDTGNRLFNTTHLP